MRSRCEYSIIRGLRTIPGSAETERRATRGTEGLSVEFLRKRNVRKEDRVKEILARRGQHVGLVCIFSVMEPCSTYKPWHNKQQARHTCCPMTANACTTTSISSTSNWDCAT